MSHRLVVLPTIYGSPLLLRSIIVYLLGRCLTIEALKFLCNFCYSGLCDHLSNNLLTVFTPYIQLQTKTFSTSKLNNRVIWETSFISSTPAINTNVYATNYPPKILIWLKSLLLKYQRSMWWFCLIRKNIDGSMTLGNEEWFCWKCCKFLDILRWL